MRASATLVVVGGALAPLAAAALLVLRAACPASLRHLFHEEQLAQAGVSTHSLRILSYEETCGAEWSVAVSRAGLAALGGGGAVLVVGAANEACAALGAGARALRRPQGTACARGGARAAALQHLARRLHWSRALVPPASSCQPALHDATRALVAAGLHVRHAPLDQGELARQPHVVIVCASEGAEIVAGATMGALGAGPALLILLAGERALRPRAPHTSQISNISLAVSESLGYQKNRSSNLSSEEVAARGGSRVSTSYFHRGVSRSITSSDEEELTPVKNNSKMDVVRTESTDGERVIADEFHPDSPKSISHAHVNMSEEFHESTLALSDLRQIYLVDFTDAVLSPRQTPFFCCTLLLSDGELRLNSYVSEQAVIDEIKEVLRRESEATLSRVEHNKADFHLYQWSDGSVASWRQVAILTTGSYRSLDSEEEWVHSVEWRNVSTALDKCSAITAEEVEGSGSAVALSATACGVVLVSCGAALAVRCAVRRRRRGRRRADVLLSATDFTFPGEERRAGEGAQGAKVQAEGVESAVASWLRQLHEAGGPAPLPPDVLQQPALAAPRAPSAPSSVCSVNRLPADRRVRYKGEVVHLKYLADEGGPLELKRKTTDVLLVMQNLRHENINPFIGWLCEARALVWAWCARGSLQDVLRADAVTLDWTFRLSLLTDVVRGMRHLHASPLRVHGRLSSRNCVVDARWLLRLTDYGLPALAPPRRAPPRDLLWTAPELLRDLAAGRTARPTQPADVFSFAIVMQEVIVRGEPYCMLPLAPDEIVEKLCRPPPLVRPSVSLGAAPPDAVSVMRQCWSEAPDLRPDFHRLHDVFRLLHKGRKVNVVDSMFEMLEKYSNNLEELVRERTEQLDAEKKKTEQLLNRMLPRSVAERLMAGARVEPEEFPDVTIYFSDIVGFTALAARSTPVQVVELLNELYSRFDAAVERHGAYKVETIGDAYMVVGGLPARAVDHAPRLARLALRLLHEAGRFRVRHLPATPLHLRAGLHSGPVCAAVVGLSMPRYCLFGDAVNTAARMESTGAAWRIQVSGATAARLQAAGGFRLRSRGLTQVKGKGAMHTYWLLGADGFDEPLPTPPPLEDEEVLLEVDGEDENETRVATTSAPPEKGQATETASSTDNQGAPCGGGGSPRPPCSPHPAPAAPARYRCLGEGRSGVRRQWSLEGEGVCGSAARGAGAGGSVSAPPSPPSPLLLASAPPPRAPRYRKRFTEAAP